MASFSSNRASIRHQLGQIITGSSDVSISDATDQSLFEIALEEGVNGLLWQKFIESDIAIDEGFRESLVEQVHDLKLKHMRMQHACGRILASLEQAAIPVVCMRGLSVTESLYGNDAALRPISDIDLLLDQRQMLDAKQVLWNIGFRPDDKYRNIYARGDISIDLHYEPLGIERIQMWRHLTPLRIDDFMKYVTVGKLAGEEARLLHVRLNLPYLCFHAMKHSFERLIWLYDIALLANEIDAQGGWGEVLAGIYEYKLERPCFYALSYVKEHLDASLPEGLLEKIRPEMNFVERSLFRRFMNHGIIPFLAERLFARMQPDFAHRVRFWRETIYPRYEVREQMVEEGCVKCNFIRKRLKQLIKAAWLFIKEGATLIRS
ncbi:MAG: nucleotidyltransferase family protein [Mariprofundaceae bacterium]